MKLSTRFIASFILIGVITALLGALSLNRLTAVHDASRVASETRLPSGRLIAAMDADLARIRLAEVQRVLANPKERAEYVRASEKSLAALVFDQSRYQPLIATSTEAELYKGFTEDLRSYMVERDRVLALSDSGQGDLARAALERASRDRFERASTRLQELTELGVQASVDAQQRVELQYVRSRTLIMVFSAATTATGLLFAFIFMVSVTRPLNALVRGAERIGVGDLSQRVTIHTHEEFRKLAESLNRLARTLGTAHESLEQQAAATSKD